MPAMSSAAAAQAAVAFGRWKTSWKEPRRPTEHVLPDTSTGRAVCGACPARKHLRVRAAWLGRSRAHGERLSQ